MDGLNSGLACQGSARKSMIWAGGGLIDALDLRLVPIGGRRQRREKPRLARIAIFKAGLHKERICILIKGCLYYNSQTIRDKGAWEEWLRFFLRGVAEVSAQATETSRRILTLRESHRDMIVDKLGYAAGNGHRVLERLFEGPIVSVKEVRELTGTTYPAANQLVERLAKIGVLAEITGQARNRRFRYDTYVQLFDEPERNGGADATSQ
jgi:hypothetical protein